MINVQIIYALLASFFIGGVAGYLGSLMVTKRMALMGGALGHLSIPGVALAMFYNFDVSLGALIFLFFGVILIWFFEQKTKLPVEALTAVIFASSISIAFLFLPEGKTTRALIGDISHISFEATLVTVLLSIIIFILIRKIYASLILISISSDLASSLHINVKKYNLIYLISIMLVVALGVRIVGGLLTAALVAIPACTSRNLSKNLFQYSYGSILFGCLACILGPLMNSKTGVSIGPLIIIFSSFLFLLSFILRNIFRLKA